MNRLLLALILTLACRPPLTEANAAEQTAKTICKKSKSCDTNAWHNLYGEDMEECVDEQTEVWGTIVSLGGLVGLELDLDELKNCLSDVRKASCEEIERADFGPNCDDVFSF